MKGTIFILSVLLLAGCSVEDQMDRSKLSVFASIPPQAGLIKKIAGEHAAVHTLVGEGQSPHNYEPSARQLARLGQADLLFTIGVPFEHTLLAKIGPLYPDLPIVATQDQVKHRAMPHVHHGEPCTHDHGTPDPHIWLTPLNALAVAERIGDALITLDPDHAADYRQKLDQLADELKKLDADIRHKLAPYQGSRFYVFHPSFGYFADAYGLEQVPIELDGKSPSPRQLARLIEQARTDGIRVVFVQKQFPAESARAIADAIGGTVIPLDPLAEDVVANLRKIADSMVQALEQ